MRNRVRNRLLAIAIAGATLATPLVSEAGQGKGRARGQENGPGLRRGWDVTNQGRGRSNNNSRVFQDPASATGYDSGYDLGLVDGREGTRYDPVRHKDYRDAERGYAQSYGSRDGYKTNFRSGFRQGYEDGYREGTRNRK
jgi:hypothetical protein